MILMSKYENMTVEELLGIMDASDFNDRPMSEKLEIAHCAVHKRLIQLDEQGMLKPLSEVYNPSKYEDDSDER